MRLTTVLRSFHKPIDQLSPSALLQFLTKHKCKKPLRMGFSGAFLLRLPTHFRAGNNFYIEALLWGVNPNVVYFQGRIIKVVQVVLIGEMLV